MATLLIGSLLGRYWARLDGRESRQESTRAITVAALPLLDDLHDARKRFREDNALGDVAARQYFERRVLVMRSDDLADFQERSRATFSYNQKLCTKLREVSIELRRVESKHASVQELLPFPTRWSVERTPYLTLLEGAVVSMRACINLLAKYASRDTQRAIREHHAMRDH